MNNINKKSIVKQWDSSEVVIPKRTFEKSPYGDNEFLDKEFTYVPEFNSEYSNVEKDVKNEMEMPVVEQWTTATVRDENKPKIKIDKKVIAGAIAALMLLLN